MLSIWAQYRECCERGLTPSSLQVPDSVLLALPHLRAELLSLLTLLPSKNNHTVFVNQLGVLGWHPALHTRSQLTLNNVELIQFYALFSYG